MYGPVVLAVRDMDYDPTSKIDFDHPERSLARCADEPLSFRLVSDPFSFVRPFFRFRQGEKYYLYFDTGKA
jgi:hypothetical protein